MKNILIIFSLLLLSAAPVSAEPKDRGEVVQGESGLDLPRFVSIASNRANLRTGPGEQYPIIWVYERKLYPLEIIEEYESWRRVRDRDGDEGWMHVVLLSGNRTAIVEGDIQVIFENPDITSLPIARVQAGVIAEILECSPDWCRIDVGPEDGWIEPQYLWGTYIGEIIE